MREYCVTIREKIKIGMRKEADDVDRRFTISAKSKKGAVRAIRDAGYDGELISVEEMIVKQPVSKGKAAWEMTLLEFGKSKLPPSIRKQITEARQVKSYYGQHAKEVRAALDRGDNVSYHILKEFRGQAWADKVLAKMEEKRDG